MLELYSGMCMLAMELLLCRGDLANWQIMMIMNMMMITGRPYLEKLENGGAGYWWVAALWPDYSVQIAMEWL